MGHFIRSCSECRPPLQNRYPSGILPDIEPAELICSAIRQNVGGGTVARCDHRLHQGRPSASRLPRSLSLRHRRRRVPFSSCPRTHHRNPDLPGHGLDHPVRRARPGGRPGPPTGCESRSPGQPGGAEGAKGRRRSLLRPGLLQDRRLPARLHPRPASPPSSSSARPTTSRSTPPRTAPHSPTPTWRKYKAVILLSTTGDVLNADQQAAFERYIKAGGGYVGIHAASDTEYNWAWYGELVGAYFNQPPGEPAGHGQGRGPRPPVHGRPAGPLVPYRRVVQLPDQPAAARARAGQPGREELHPRRRRDGRRPPDRLVSGLRRRPLLVHRPAATPRSRTPSPSSSTTCSAASRPPPVSMDADCGASQSPASRRSRWTSNTSNPMELDIAPDGRVFYIERDGARADHQAGHRQHRDRGRPGRLHRQRGRPARHRARPGLRHQQLGVPLLLAERPGSPATGCPGSRSPATRIDLASETGAPRGRRRSATVLPRRRQHGLRQRRQPVPGHR